MHSIPAIVDLITHLKIYTGTGGAQHSPSSTTHKFPGFPPRHRRLTHTHTHKQNTIFDGNVSINITNSCVSHYGGWFSRNVHAPRTDSQLPERWSLGRAAAAAAIAAWFAEFILWPPAVATSWFDYLLLIFFGRSWPRYKRPTMPSNRG